MDLSRENFRAIIYYNFRRGLTQKQCIDQLTSTFEDEAPSKTTVYHLFSEFNRELSMLTDEFKEGRLKLVVVPQNIDAVRELIMQHRHITYSEIKASLQISMMQISEPLDRRWSPPPMNTRNVRGVTSALPPLWKGIKYLMQRGRSRVLYACFKCCAWFEDYETLLGHLYWRHGTESQQCPNCPLRKWQIGAHKCNVLPQQPNRFSSDTSSECSSESAASDSETSSSEKSDSSDSESSDCESDTEMADRESHPDNAPRETPWCYCGKNIEGETMIGCDAQTCSISFVTIVQISSLVLSATAQDYNALLLKKVLARITHRATEHPCAVNMNASLNLFAPLP
ncbi:hypothetical protein EVAR_57541_1 [Eumeta japonica]|uniref:C2H2-type domain-containing protein n=1 Tax=Eumeta variegata TaxID=151549 RepID=A0A4C1Y432_EUMVA|nr:hypothetical protein EVAR_57541_1 [Eumeta japonica]